MYEFPMPVSIAVDHQGSFVLSGRNVVLFRDDRRLPPLVLYKGTRLNVHRGSLADNRSHRGYLCQKFRLPQLIDSDGTFVDILVRVDDPYDPVLVFTLSSPLAEHFVCTMASFGTSALSPYGPILFAAKNFDLLHNEVQDIYQNTGVDLKDEVEILGSMLEGFEDCWYHRDAELPDFKKWLFGPIVSAAHETTRNLLLKVCHADIVENMTKMEVRSITTLTVPNTECLHFEPGAFDTTNLLYAMPRTPCEFNTFLKFDRCGALVAARSGVGPADRAQTCTSLLAKWHLWILRRAIRVRAFLFWWRETAFQTNLSRHRQEDEKAFTNDCSVLVEGSTKVMDDKVVDCVYDYHINALDLWMEVVDSSDEEEEYDRNDEL